MIVIAIDTSNKYSCVFVLCLAQITIMRRKSSKKLSESHFLSIIADRFYADPNLFWEVMI